MECDCFAFSKETERKRKILEDEKNIMTQWMNLHQNKFCKSDTRVTAVFCLFLFIHTEIHYRYYKHRF